MEEDDFTLLVLFRNSVGDLALGFHAIKPEQFYHVDLRNLPYIWTLYKCTYNATNQLVTRIICTKHALHHG